MQLRFTCLTAVSLSAASSHSIMSPNTAKVVRGCGVIAVSSLSLTACTTLLRRLREDKLKNCQWHRPVCQCYCCCCSWLPLSSLSAGHRVAVSSSACTLSVVPHSSAGLSLSLSLAFFKRCHSPRSTHRRGYPQWGRTSDRVVSAASDAVLDGTESTASEWLPPA